jgi:hypothetical protein
MNAKIEIHKEKIMKSKRIFLLFILLVALLTLTLSGMAAENESNYGHVSFVEDQATIIRSDQAEDKAVVNLPLVPGDTIVTGNNGRCELQFDNGTVIRLDKNTSLRLTTVQAPTLSSIWKVTTLHLLQGQLYTLPQTYDMEMFQIITPNAAVKLESRTAATIRFDADLSTALFSDAGKFEVLYGADSATLKKVKVKSGHAYVIDAANTLTVSSEKRNLEFVAWNEYVDRHFRELHFGISKVPPKLKFGNSALQYWAEKWSSRFGEWIYDELFGYVWKPADERFANSARPFFYANHVWINGQLFLVPQETWGWAPAHMGTWVWLNRGWTWIPGGWYHADVVFAGRFGYFYPDFDFYFWYVYGGFDLYDIYREQGNDVWRENYYRQFHKHYKKPPLKDLPRGMQKIFKRINKVPLAAVAGKLNAGPALSGLEAKKIPLPAVPAKADFLERAASGAPPASGNASLSKSQIPDADMSVKGKIRAGGESKNFTGRDWNPDSRWADEYGYSIHYSSSRNAVICPELNISSDRERLLDRVGSAGFVLPAQVFFPENSSQPSTNSTSGNGSITRDIATDVRAEKKDDSGK